MPVFLLMFMACHEHSYTPRYAGEFKRGEAVEVEKCSQPIKLEVGRLLWETGKEHKMDSVLEHTKWNCRYHIVWSPKYRRKIIYGKYRQEIGKILRKLCEYKGVEIVEANACVDHIHTCLKIPPKYSAAQIMGYLKGKSSLMLFERFQNLKYKFENRTFWCKGYYVSTVGLNEETIKKYIRNQQDHDKATDNIKRPD